MPSENAVLARPPKAGQRISVLMCYQVGKSPEPKAQRACFCDTLAQRWRQRCADNPYEIPRKAISGGDNLVGVFWKLAVKNKRKDRYA